MKIIRRFTFSNPVLSAAIFMTPLMTYFILKVIKAPMHNQWIWLIAIPTLVLGWFLVNFKIVKK